jgi:UTRA domain
LFGAEPGTALLRRDFVFYARGEPEQISVNFLPLELVTGTPVADPAREPWPGGTLAQLAYLGHPVSRVEESVSARMPTEPEAQTLQVGQGVPVFAVLRRLISGDDVLEVCRHIVIPADRVVLEYGIDIPPAGDPTDLARSRCSSHGATDLLPVRGGCEAAGPSDGWGQRERPRPSPGARQIPCAKTVAPVTVFAHGSRTTGRVPDHAGSAQLHAKTRRGAPSVSLVRRIAQ